MKKTFNTSKFYYAFPIFILGYKDEKISYNITTCSSSFSLGDMVVIGMFKGSNAVKQISKFKEFTINIPTKEQGFLMEKAGFLTKRDKLTLLSVPYELSSVIDAPLLEKCPVSMECRVEQIQEFGEYVNFTARIINRWCDETLLDTKGNFKSAIFSPIEYIGDEKRRVYRYLDDKNSDKLGTFIRSSKYD